MRSGLARAADLQEKVHEALAGGVFPGFQAKHLAKRVDLAGGILCRCARLGQPAPGLDVVGRGGSHYLQVGKRFACPPKVREQAREMFVRRGIGRLQDQDAPPGVNRAVGVTG